ncbi:MAG: MFS transporter [Omnitrophica WOR_2 bacterium]
MNRPTRWYDYISINIYFFGLSTLSQTNSLVTPLLVQQFVGEQVKGSYLGSLRLWTLMVALLFQALMGMLSDRSRLSWGRRRPFILIGTLVNLVFVVLVGYSSTMNGMAGFSFLFTIAILQQIASNTAQSAQQGLIPDLVPDNQRGKFSGIKAVLEVPLPLILVAFTVGRLISAGNLWAALILAMVVLAAAMLLAMLAPEKPFKEALPPLDWKPILRLASMTVVFTLIILGVGQAVKQIGVLEAGAASPGILLVALGLGGLAAMLIAVGLGVWLSVRISIGEQAARRYPSFTWWVVNRLAFLVGAVNLSTFAVYFIQARLGYVREKAAGPAAQLMLVVGVCILLSALLSGFLADRFGRKSLVAISGLVAALGTLIALLFPNLVIIFLGGGLIGIATGLFYSANWALGTDLVPKAEAGRYLGISNLAGAGAGAVGAYIGGPIADYFTVHFPQMPGLGYILLFSIYGLLFLLSVLALAGVREPKAEPEAFPRAAGLHAE